MYILPLSYDSWTDSAYSLLDRDLRAAFKQTSETISTILEKHSGESVYETKEWDEICEWGYESSGNLLALLEYLRAITHVFEMRFARNSDTKEWQKTFFALTIQMHKLQLNFQDETKFPILFKTKQKDVVQAYREYYCTRKGNYSGCYKPDWR